VLLHPTSLPGPHGNGDLGEEARRFVDFLAMAGQRWWQMLPVAPPGYGSSPYSAQSAFAGSPMLVSLDALVTEGLLQPEEIASDLPRERVDYAAASELRARALRLAFERYRAQTSKNARARAELATFREENATWLEDFALFRAIKRANGEVQWTAWEDDLKLRRKPALARARRELAGEIDLECFEQLVFQKQFAALRAYAAERSIGLIGDIPIFVAHDSADVWQHRELFRLDRGGEPTVISGVPPDYFSTTGQRWGNPLYRWARLRKTGYAWWVDRFRRMLERFDAVRIDHFIGFQRYWEIPASEATAVNGRWMKGPGAHFFATVEKKLGTLPLIAEDLGAVTPAVTALRDKFHLPGIKVLQFAFGSDPSAKNFLPHNYPRRAVVYTGTHDNDTTVAWFNEKGGEASTRSTEQAEKERRAVLDYVSQGGDGTDIHWDMIRAALASVARVAMVPLQDILGLGAEARMNRPGVASENWAWRFSEWDLTHAVAERLFRLTSTYGRAKAAP
jgi:4-alpha-glucanotransferase